MMASKRWKSIDDRLARIEQRLGITEDVEPRQQQPEPETPEQVAERIDYDSYAAAEVIERADSLTAEERKALAQYEKANKKRSTVLRALEAE